MTEERARESLAMMPLCEHHNRGTGMRRVQPAAASATPIFTFPLEFTDHLVAEFADHLASIGPADV